MLYRRIGTSLTQAQKGRNVVARRTFLFQTDQLPKIDLHAGVVGTLLPIDWFIPIFRPTILHFQFFIFHFFSPS